MNEFFNFSQELQVIKNILRSPKITRAELMGLRASLITLALRFPKKINSVNSSINHIEKLIFQKQDESLPLAKKLLKLFE